MINLISIYCGGQCKKHVRIHLFILAYRLFSQYIFDNLRIPLLWIMNYEYVYINDVICRATVRNAMCFRYCIKIKLCIMTRRTYIRIYGFSLIHVYLSTLYSFKYFNITHIENMLVKGKIILMLRSNTSKENIY